MLGQFFLVWASTKQLKKCLTQGHNSDTQWGSNNQPFDPQSNALPTEPLHIHNIAHIFWTPIEFYSNSIAQDKEILFA